MDYKIPKGATSNMHFAFFSTFGRKEPIFSSEQLSLCEKSTLLLLRRFNDGNESGIPLLLHSAEEGKFGVSFKVCVSY